MKINKDIEIIDSSIHILRKNYYFILKIKGERFLGIFYKSKRPKNFEGTELFLKNNKKLLLCPLSEKNADEIRKIFPQHSPSVVKKNKFIFGFGYRSPYLIGNIIQAKIAKNYKNVTPILAQQSVRELQRTKRTFKDVLNSATWATFEANISFWGADADHLKHPKDAKEPAKLGFTHFTIDPSDRIIFIEDGNELEKEFLKFSKKERERILNTYRGKPFKIDIEYNFTEQKIKKIALKYRDIFELLKSFLRIIKKETKKDVGIELSLDETAQITSPEEMIYLLEEFKRRDIKIDEIAPRFSGEFEKAIDYFSGFKNGKKLRNTKEFEEHLSSLYKIAKNYKVKLCLHSGSDKFSIYPILRKITSNNIHIKTAGTFFLEEIRLLAKLNPELFKKIYEFSKKVFETEKATYKLTTNIENIPDLKNLDGKVIYQLLDTKKGNEELRQLLHVCYGKILTNPEFLQILGKTISLYEDELFKIFSVHIKRHLKIFKNS
jgi:hypothetical protein